jgi:hypothetical protein
MMGGTCCDNTEAINQWNRLSWFSESSTK